MLLKMKKLFRYDYCYSLEKEKKLLSSFPFRIVEMKSYFLVASEGVAEVVAEHPNHQLEHSNLSHCLHEQTSLLFLHQGLHDERSRSLNEKASYPKRRKQKSYLHFVEVLS